MALNARQQAFVREYLVDLNATAAYRRAGYKARGNAAEVNAARLLRNAQVQAAIQAALAQRAQRTEVDADRVVRELARLAFSDLRQLVRWSAHAVVLQDSGGVNDDAAAAVAEVSQTITQTGGTVKIKLHSKTQALKMLGQHLGLFGDAELLRAIAQMREEILALTRAARAGTSPSGAGGPQAPVLP